MLNAVKVYTGLANLEINAPKKYFKHSETPCFRVVSDKDNPDAYDANFAVLKSIENAAESVKQAEIFHEAAGAVPLFAWAPDSVPEEDARAILQPFGYAFHRENLTVMSIMPKASYKDVMPYSCNVQVLSTLTNDSRALVNLAANGEEFSALMLDKKLAAGAKAFVAINADKGPVSYCVAEGYGEAMYLCDVFTRRETRRLGYARAVMCAALEYAFEKSYHKVYLHVASGEARALYEKIGFKAEADITVWKAFKGGLPEYMEENKEGLDIDAT